MSAAPLPIEADSFQLPLKGTEFDDMILTHMSLSPVEAEDLQAEDLLAGAQVVPDGFWNFAGAEAEGPATDFFAVPPEAHPEPEAYPEPKAEVGHPQVLGGDALGEPLPPIEDAVGESQGASRSNRYPEDALWPPHLLTMELREVNAYMREHGFSKERIQQLRGARRRAKNRAYAKTSRRRKNAKQKVLATSHKKLVEQDGRLREQHREALANVDRLRREAMALRELLLSQGTMSAAELDAHMALYQ